MVIKKKTGKKVKHPKIVTPVGRLSYPYLNEPDTGRENSDDKYKTDLLIPKDVWKEQGKELRETVLEVGRKFYKDKSLQLSDFKNPFKDTDKIKKYSASKEVRGCILIRCKSEFEPVILDANKEDLDESARKKIKGGDYARLVVVVYPYSNGDGGVTLGLNLVQYVKPGNALGGGRAALIDQLDEIEIDAEDITPDDSDEDDSEEEEEQEEAPKKRGRPKKEEVEEEEEEESDDEPEEEEEEADEPDEEEEDEKPTSKKKKGKAKKADDDDFDFSDD